MPRNLSRRVTTCIASLICVFILEGRAATFTWNGEGAIDLMSDPTNWVDGKAPESLDNDFVFGPLASGAPPTVAVDLPGNVCSVAFASGAQAMTLRAVPPNDSLQFADSGIAVPLTNRSGHTQTFVLSLRQFWIGGGPVRRWDAAEGNLVFNGAVILRGEDLVAKAVTWELAATGDMTFQAPVVSAENWESDTTVTVVKKGEGTLTFEQQAQWNGVTSVEEGVVVVNGSLDAKGDLTVAPSAALQGDGTIASPCTVDGSLAPGGSAIGTLRFAAGLRLSGKAEFGIDPTALREVNADRAVVSCGLLVYGGELHVTVSAPADRFVRGQVFKLFEWGEGPPEGRFTRVDLPKLPPDLRWQDNLVHDGTIVVGP